MYAVIPPAAALLGVAAIYGPRILTGPSLEIAPELVQKEIGEFSLHNGFLLPHKQYLYGSSEIGQPFIMGKKLAGEDYSAWEAEYATFPKLKSLTLASPEAKSTYSWSLEPSKASNGFDFWQLLLWLMIGIVCALFIRVVIRKVMSRFSPTKYNNQPKVLAPPPSVIEWEHSLCSDVWRRTLLGMYRERKSEILSLSKIAVHYIDSCDNFRKLVIKERKKKGEAKSALAKAMAEHADEVAKLKTEIDNLRQMLDAKSNGPKESEINNRETGASDTAAQETLENIGDAAGSEGPVVDPVIETAHQTPDHTGNTAGSEIPIVDTEPQKKINDPKQMDDTKSSSAKDSDTTSANGAAGSASAHETSENMEAATGNQNTVVNPVDGTLPGQTVKPKKPRANRRADGSIRTPSHPNYVPLEASPSHLGDKPFLPAASPSLLGDKPFLPSGRGNGWNRGPRGGGRGGGGNRGGYSGWRGGRGGGNAYGGQPNHGMGQ